MSAPLLQTRRLAKSFGGVKAVRDVSLAVADGSILALIGPNGAGKSTFVNLLTGTLKPSSGEVQLSGRPITGLPPHRIVRGGMVRTFQNGRLFARLSAIENVMVGATARVGAGLGHALLRRTAGEALPERALAAMQRVGLDRLDPHAEVGSLPYGQQRMLEIARALVAEPVLLLLDEPAAGLNSGEVEGFLDLLRSLRGDGLTMLLIEHNMGLVMRAADRIAVLNFGELIAEGTPTEVRQNPAVLEAYLGRGYGHA